MFDPTEYNRRTKRIQQKDRHIKRQCAIIGHSRSNAQKSPHMFAKKSATNCGNSRCIYCTNPRKMFNELTLKEKSFHRGADLDGLE